MVPSIIPVSSVRSEQSCGGIDNIRENIAQREIPGALSYRIALAKANPTNSSMTHVSDRFHNAGLHFLKVDQSPNENQERSRPYVSICVV